MKIKSTHLLIMVFFSTLFFGQVGINTAMPNAKAGLHISERKDPANVNPDVYNGLIIQRYTTAERDANFTTTAAEDGLTIYNTSEKCYNYYQATNTKWLSLCGTYPKAVYTVSCSSVKIFGTYTQGTSLNTSNYITMSVTITQAGTYDIVAKTTNGYYFSKSGLFPSTGTFNITLDASGLPVAGPQNDTLSFIYNGVTDTTCTNKTVSVLGSQVSYSITCGGAVVSGSYNKAIQLDYDTNTVTIPLSNVETAGSINITTSTNNGVSFTSTESITLSSTSITLHGVSTPTSAGKYTFTFTTNGANPQTCTFSVVFGTTIGTFANPANRCMEIFNEGKTTDGYYWVKDAGGSKFKTYCDMSNGGWTLIKSLSERQIIVVDKIENEGIYNQAEKNAVTTETGIFNEYAFALSSATVNNIGSSTGTTRYYRFSIKEKGQTGTTLSDVESTTVAPTNDYWTQANYINATVTDGNMAAGQYNNYGNTVAGKLFGLSFGKAVSGVTSFQINGIPFYLTIYGLQGLSYYTGIYGGVGYASANNSAANDITYTYPTGQTYTFNKYYINDLFGVYMNTEQQLNHHIGTCSGVTDDYGGASFCNNGWANWRAHRFNLKAGNYEGRIVQYWVK